MFKTKIKKISILILRADFDRFIRELILFGCVDIGASDDEFEDSGLDSLAERKKMDLGQYNANRDAITVFETDYTLLMTGWIPVKSVDNLLTILSGYIHAWGIRDPSPDEIDKVPIRILPKFFGKLLSGTRRSFSPLVFEEKVGEI